MAIKLNTPKGTRDFSPAEMVRRNYIFDTIKGVFKKYGYQPIETPAMENLETLTGKYGEEGDRLIFKILNSGDFLGKSILENPFQFVEIIKKIRREVGDTISRVIANGGFQTDEKGFPTLVELNWTKFLNKPNSRETQFLQILEYSYFQFIVSSSPEEYILVKNHKDSKDGLSAYRFYEEVLKGKVAVFDKQTYLKAQVEFDFEQFIESNTVREILKRHGIENGTVLPSSISEKALRYDLTVPFARYVVQHRNEITFPFKRYQVQPVWRADRPQKGRYREFYQCDIDVIGSDSLLNEVEMVQVVDEVFGKLNVPVTVKINNRKLLAAIAEVIGAPDSFVDITVALDKLDKIGEEKVVNELRERGISDDSIEKLLPLLRFRGNTSEKLDFLKSYLGENEAGQKGIAEVSEVLETAQKLISNKTVLELDLTLARGLNYYTGAIFEVRSNIEGTLSSSISGGGRYDDLTGIFGMKDVSGVGISFGADRIYDVLEGAGLFPEFTSDSTQVFFVNFGAKEAAFCLGICKQLREAGINTELYPDNAKMKKQMTYANNNDIPFVAMVGTREMEESTIGLKNMKTGEQSSVTISELISNVSG